MEFRVLGSVEVVAGGQPLALRGRKQRTLLAALLVHANEVVATERLIDALWDERPPETARAALQVYVSQLRRLLGGDRIVTRAHGYLLRVEEEELDVERFERLVSETGGAAGPVAAAKLREALALWRGPPFAGFEQQPFALAEIARLDELRLGAEERRIEQELALGGHAQLLPELEAMVNAHPYRERLRAQLMLALYRAGRQAEALEAYRLGRETLVDRLGIDPGPELRHLERAILEHDPELLLCSPEPATAADGQQKPRSPWARSTSLVGRRREQREIRVLLSRPDVRLLTLTGAAGTGKTRLALEAMVGVEAEFPDGVVLVELASIRDPNLVAAAIAAALGLGEMPGQGAAEALFAFLRRQQALLVLDNFEQVLAAAPMLSELLTRAPGITVLATSRAPLELADERLYPVSALQLPDPTYSTEVGRLRRTDSVRLFVERARDARADFELSESNAAVVAELCVRLDGLPLALELAAARIRLLSPRDILARLGRKLEPLRAEPGSGAPDRHRTLRAAIEWSYNLLDTQQQQLFTSLGVFVGGFTLDGAAAVAGDPELDIVDGVEPLLHNSLLTTERMVGGEPRFGMLETIHDYALERLEERGDGEAVRHRHARFYLPLAEEAGPALLGPQQLNWLDRLDAERDNLRAALTWATECGEAELGLRICAALWRYWQLRGTYAEGREWLERLLAGRSGSKTTRAIAQARIASLAFVQGDHEAVRRFGEASLPVLRRVTYEEKIAGVLFVMTNSALALGEVDRASALADEALELAKRTGDLTTETFARYTFGLVLAWRGELDEARLVCEESVRRARQLGDVRSIANWLRTLGGIAIAQGESDRARTLFNESLAIHRTLDDQWGISRSTSRLAIVMLEAHDHDAARRMLAESLTIERKMGDRPGLIFNLELCAKLAAAENQPARATRLYACASVLRDSVGPHPVEVGWPSHASHVTHLRSFLGEDEFAEAWAQGRTMTLNESLDYAVETATSAEPA